MRQLRYYVETSVWNFLLEEDRPEQLIPPRYLDDALHIATAVVHEMDVVVSWNFEHLVKLKTRLGVNGLNRLLGYREIEIVSPEEAGVP